MIEIEQTKITGVAANLLKQEVSVIIKFPVNEENMDIANKLRLLAQAEVVLLVTFDRLQPELPMDPPIPAGQSTFMDIIPASR